MRLRSLCNVQRLYVSLLAVALANVSVAARLQTRAKVEVDDPRPVSAVITELEKRHQRVITYEDPIRVHPSDIVDGSTTVPKDRRRASSNFLFPKGGPFSFFYDPPEGSGRSSMIRMLESLVEQYNGVSRDAQFRVAQTREILHVLPAISKNPLGTLKSSALPLDTIITLPEGQRSGLDQLEVIRQAVRASGYPKFGIGNVPMNTLRRPVDAGMRTESARAALVRIMESFPNKMSYRVLCDAGANPYCLVNIHGIPAQSQ